VEGDKVGNSVGSEIEGLDVGEYVGENVGPDDVGADVGWHETKQQVDGQLSWISIRVSMLSLQQSILAHKRGSVSGEHEGAEVG
jgi:hypothetical protein